MVVERDNIIAFYSTRDVFSNFYPVAFEFDGFKFRTSEQCFMYQKAKLFGDADVARKIIDSKTPAEAKRLGRSVAGFDESVWSEHRIKLMVSANLAKFTSSEALLSKLISTGDKRLVEASKTDRIWGVGLGIDDDRVFNESEWRGTNLLGQALEQVRGELLARLDDKHGSLESKDVHGGEK